MVSGGGGDYHTSAGWPVRGMHLLLLLEFLLLSIGTATPSSKEYGDHPMLTMDDSMAPSNKFRLNSYAPALQEFQVHSTQKIVWSSRSRTGPLCMLRRFIAQFCSAAIMDSCPIEGSHDHHYNRQKIYKVGSREDVGVESSSDSGLRSRKLLLRRAGYPKQRSSSPGYFSALDHQKIHNEGRRVLEETVSSPVLPATQQVLMGPPAPPDLVHNEKQDWNQDYAEPDVHPPSSN